VQVMVLSEGYTIYYGDANRAVDWFTHSLGYAGPSPTTSPADYILDLVNISFQGHGGSIKPAMSTTTTTTTTITTTKGIFTPSRKMMVIEDVISAANEFAKSEICYQEIKSQR